MKQVTFMEGFKDWPTATWGNRNAAQALLIRFLDSRVLFSYAPGGNSQQTISETTIDGVVYRGIFLFTYGSWDIKHVIKFDVPKNPGKDRLHAGFRICATAALDMTTPFIWIAVGGTLYSLGIPAVATGTTYYEVVYDPKDKKVHLYNNGVLLRSSAALPAVPNSVNIGGNSGTIGNNRQWITTDIYTGIDSDYEEGAEHDVFGPITVDACAVKDFIGQGYTATSGTIIDALNALYIQGGTDGAVVMSPYDGTKGISSFNIGNAENILAAQVSLNISKGISSSAGIEFHLEDDQGNEFSSRKSVPVFTPDGTSYYNFILMKGLDDQPLTFKNLEKVKLSVRSIPVRDVNK
jgi:hypothetical protein